MMKKFYCFVFLTCVILKVYAVPPSVCRAEFRWDDCGKPPKAVMYYWKQGSRCEIGIWKGCLPNVNMFADEYECINTCVFVDRPSVRTESEEPETDPPTTVDNTTDVTTEGGGNETSTEAEGNATAAEGDGNATAAAEGKETAAEGSTAAEGENPAAEDTPAEPENPAEPAS
ncbi:uncharacterized protein LOC125226778 [Leguminivora glycinivorella]|uniref:uncharacterized protein LOC125226778 n=1 Tax=Leguminivora glycinivorella TaxID=1035111 RepID=UPI00200E24CA|nr:uncharacterized protein LOC125226778 [Leguminivora glycinivorella]